MSEINDLRLRLVEAQMTVLQYQHKEITAIITQEKAAEAQMKFDASVDAKDMPASVK